MQDDDDIPLLDDVVDPGALDLRATAGAYEEDDTEPSGYEEVLEVLREGVAAQLLKELQPLVDAAIADTLEEISEQIKQSLRHELQDSIESRLHQLIGESVQKAFRSK
jgi:hypothetical protein